MTTFVRLLAEKNKEVSLAAICAALRRGEAQSQAFEVESESFRAVPGAPFAYWVSEAVRDTFRRLPSFDGKDRIARVTNPAGDDTRFIRAWWEVRKASTDGLHSWINFSKGGAFSPFFYDVHLVVRWSDSRKTYHGFIGTEHRPLEKPACLEHFFRPGLTWPRRTQGGLSFRALPAGCIFADKGPAAFVVDDEPDELLALLALVNSRAFALLVSLQMSFGSYEVGVIQRTPVPVLSADHQTKLSKLARRAWSLKRRLDTIKETSHAFLLPAAIRSRLGDYDPPAIEAELALIQVEIDDMAFDLYGFSEIDRLAANADYSTGTEAKTIDSESTDDDSDNENNAQELDQSAELLAWAMGVAFGRFGLGLATGELALPPEPEPFDPLPAKSLGMLPDGAIPFHAQAGILVDDPGHPHDLTRQLEEVFARIHFTVPPDVRRWLGRECFDTHLKCYSKSRRKAPIYWPLATASGGYTLWVFYPSLNSQTLYTAINDFVEPKLKQVRTEVSALRDKGAARTREDEKHFDTLHSIEMELAELRDTLLNLAPTYKPNLDDGVQMSAAPLWPLFRHKAWQKILKDTWAKLEKGDYDWAHLAMNYWPERVREKCKTDKSLAIAHGLEGRYVEPRAKPKKARGSIKLEADE